MEKVILVDPLNPDRVVEFDVLVKALMIMDHEHHQIHEGEAFAVQSFKTSVADNGTLIFGFKTPPVTASSQKRVHLQLQFATKVGCEVQIFKDSVWTQSTGTKLTIHNLRHDSSITSGLLQDKDGAPFLAGGAVLLDPTVTTPGTLKDGWAIFGSTPGGGGEGGVEEEAILDPDTVYTVVCTAEGGSNQLWLRLQWYEHEDK